MFGFRKRAKKTASGKAGKVLSGRDQLLSGPFGEAAKPMLGLGALPKTPLEDNPFHAIINDAALSPADKAAAIAKTFNEAPSPEALEKAKSDFTAMAGHVDKQLRDLSMDLLRDSTQPTSFAMTGLLSFLGDAPDISDLDNIDEGLKWVEKAGDSFREVIDRQKALKNTIQNAHDRNSDIASMYDVLDKARGKITVSIEHPAEWDFIAKSAARSASTSGHYKTLLQTAQQQQDMLERFEQSTHDTIASMKSAREKRQAAAEFATFVRHLENTGVATQRKIAAPARPRFTKPARN